MEVNGLSDSWIYELLVHTRKCAERLDKSLRDAEERDVKEIVAWVQRRDLAPSTRSDYKKAIKRFFKWRNGGEYPEPVKWINTTYRKENDKLPEKLLDEDDVQALIDAAKNPRDRAFAAVLWEIGARIGELLRLKVGSFEEHEHGRKVTLDGKTGPRKVLLISSLPHLDIWLSEHPLGSDPDAPLWCRIREREEPASDGQKNYMDDLGIVYEEGITKEEASKEIEKALDSGK